VTNVNRPSADDGLPPPWLIAIGVVGALALVFLLGAGVGQEWGAPQWGPLAEWVAGTATFAAVVVALQQSAHARREATRGHLARLVDHEVSRRRECLEAFGNLWAALVSLGADFRSLVNYLLDLDAEFDPLAQRHPGPLMGPVQTYADEIVGQIQQFVAITLSRCSLRCASGCPVNTRVAHCTPWFPHQALSADMAEWAWKTSQALAQQWWREMGLVRDPMPDLVSWKRP
jgi:hypothetical protein